MTFPARYMAVGVLLAACDTSAELPVVLRFDAQVDGVPTGCQTVRDVQAQAPLGTPPTMAQLADARMLVSGVHLRDEASGAWVPLGTNDAFPWRNEGVTLLDFENAVALCAATGTAIVNKNLSGTLPGGTYRGLRFAIGAPLEPNHTPPLQRRAASFDDDMFVSRQHGYRFVRIDWAIEGRFDRRYRVDVGNQGCDAPPPDAASTRCDQENLATVTLDDFVLGEHAVTVNLGAFVADEDLAAVKEGGTAGCTLDPTDGLTACTGPVRALGLSPDLGDCVDDCAAQSVFAVGPR